MGATRISQAVRDGQPNHIGSPGFAIGPKARETTVHTLENAMQESTNVLLREALKLPPIERAAPVERIIASLDRPDASLDALWVKEAEDRLTAYHAGEIEAIDAEAVFAELGRKA